MGTAETFVRVEGEDGALCWKDAMSVVLHPHLLWSLFIFQWGGIRKDDPT